jgi:hypothetical protein
MPGLLSDAKSCNDALKILYTSVEERDPRFEPTKKAGARSDRRVRLVPRRARVAGLEEGVHDFAQRIFKR